jgi:hypothetical protein
VGCPAPEWLCTLLSCGGAFDGESPISCITGFSRQFVFGIVNRDGLTVDAKQDLWSARAWLRIGKPPRRILKTFRSGPLADWSESGFHVIEKIDEGPQDKHSTIHALDRAFRDISPFHRRNCVECARSGWPFGEVRPHEPERSGDHSPAPAAELPRILNYRTVRRQTGG